MKRGTTAFLKFSLFLVGLICLLLCIFWLPWLAGLTAEQNPEVAYLKYPVLLGIYATGIPFYYALYHGLVLLGLIETKKAFSEPAINSLKHIKYSAIVITILYVAGQMLLISQNASHPGVFLLGMVIIFASIIIALFAALLQELLRSALEIQAENELTI